MNETQLSITNRIKLKSGVYSFSFTTKDSSGVNHFVIKREASDQRDEESEMEIYLDKKDMRKVIDALDYLLQEVDKHESEGG